MFASREARRFTTAMRKAGERIAIEIDGVMNFGDKPVYIWALLREVSKQNDRYYRNIEK